MYALALKEKGKIAEADKELARVFTNAGPYAEKAFGYMSSKDLTKSQWALRADNLMNNRSYANAEIIFRNLIRSTT